eukprot:1691037-Prymnesium_polylepis.1
MLQHSRWPWGDAREDSRAILQSFVVAPHGQHPVLAVAAHGIDNPEYSHRWLRLQFGGAR